MLPERRVASWHCKCFVVSIFWFAIFFDRTRRIRELGAVPKNLSQYEKKSDKEIDRLLKKATKELDKFAHVNKKALDQFLNFSSQRETFTDRLEELDKGAVAIHELIETLDQRKDACIQNSFKMVSQNFSKVFKEIVPGGRGEVVMRRGQVCCPSVQFQH